MRLCVCVCVSTTHCILRTCAARAHRDTNPPDRLHVCGARSRFPFKFIFISNKIPEAYVRVRACWHVRVCVYAFSTHKMRFSHIYVLCAPYVCTHTASTRRTRVAWVYFKNVPSSMRNLTGHAGHTTPAFADQPRKKPILYTDCNIKKTI